MNWVMARRGATWAGSRARRTGRIRPSPSVAPWPTPTSVTHTAAAPGATARPASPATGTATVAANRLRWSARRVARTGRRKAGAKEAKVTRPSSRPAFRSLTPRSWSMVGSQASVA